MPTATEIRQQVFEHADHHCNLLQNGLEASFDGVDTFQEWVADRIQLLGATAETFTLSPSDLEEQPAFTDRRETDSDDIRFGTNLVGRYPGRTDATTLLFGHADKAPESYQYATAVDPLDFDGNRLSGPGIADDVSGITAAIGAIETLANGGWQSTTEVLLASILGKQLGVAGTYGLMRRYDPAEAAVYIHPAESGNGLTDLKVGSNGLYECHIELRGRRPETSETHHPLYAHRGVNPVDHAGTVIRRLHRWTADLASKYPHPGVERAADTSAGSLVSDVTAGNGDRAVYESPRICTITAVIAFPPGVSLEAVEAGVRTTVNEVATEAELDGVSLRRGDHIAESAEASTESESVRVATDSIETVADRRPSYYYGHTGSDIRYPMRYWDAPTVGFGPKAGAMGDPSEWVDRTEYLETISALATFLVDFDPRG